MFIDDHLPTIKASSAARYRDSARHLLDHFGEVTLDEIGPALLKAFENKRRAQGVTTSTIRRDLACLSSMFSLAEEEEWVSNNPVRPFLRQRGRRGLVENDPKTRHLSHAEEDAILRNAPSEKVRQLIQFAIYTGLRRSEQFLIQWRDIDLEQGWIKVRAELAKSGREREVEIIPEARQMLEAMIAGATSDMAYVFPRQTGEAYSPRSPWIWEALQRSVRGARNEMHIDHVAWHDLRRTYGCRRLNDDGLSIEEVSKLLGHSSVKVTERHYAFLDIRRARARRDTQSGMVRAHSLLTRETIKPKLNQPEIITIENPDNTRGSKS